MSRGDSDKRRRYIIQACLEAMRKNHPREYDRIVEEAEELIPGGRPRFKDTHAIMQERLDEHRANMRRIQ